MNYIYDCEEEADQLQNHYYDFYYSLVQRGLLDVAKEYYEKYISV